ncbi:hypothetical protein C5S53_04695 [Methanophagales archaeon]|nr:hypothetical protein C5S53_04695 [Methanophagales archaeon]
MKSFGIAILVLVLFLIGTAVAVEPIQKPMQGECYKGIATVEGVGSFKIKNKIVVNELALNIRRWIRGDTGPNGSFARESVVVLNGGVNITDPNDPNYCLSEQISFSGDLIVGFSKYEVSAFHGSMGAYVTESYNAKEMQKQETVTIKTTSAVNHNQSLNYDVMCEFEGAWGTTAVWRKPCQKDIKQRDKYEGKFAVTKDFSFAELVVP